MRREGRAVAVTVGVGVARPIEPEERIAGPALRRQVRGQPEAIDARGHERATARSTAPEIAHFCRFAETVFEDHGPASRGRRICRMR